MLQNFVVVLIVAAAVAFLVRNFVQSARGQKGCGSCASGGCKSAARPAQAAGQELIQIQFGDGRKLVGGPLPPRRDG